MKANELITYEWWGKVFTSQDRLNSLYMSGKVARESESKTDNGFFCGTWYTFKTLSGEKIATFYVPSGFGFCSQATGVELTTVKHL